LYVQATRSGRAVRGGYALLALHVKLSSGQLSKSVVNAVVETISSACHSLMVRLEIMVWSIAFLLADEHCT
jgi:hypothetical protein